MPRSLSDGNWPLSSRQQASGYPAEISMNSLTILLFGLIFVVLVVGVFFELLFLTFFIYAVSHLYPWLRKIGVWAAKAENLLPFDSLVCAIDYRDYPCFCITSCYIAFAADRFPHPPFFPLSIWVYWYWNSGLSDGFMTSGEACSSAFIPPYGYRL
jgi:hypothetical protein